LCGHWEFRFRGGWSKPTFAVELAVRVFPLPVDGALEPNVPPSHRTHQVVRGRSRDVAKEQNGQPAEDSHGPSLKMVYMVNRSSNFRRGGLPGARYGIGF
jgi:hypothetical protein